MALSILPFWNKHCMFKYTYYMNNCWNRVREQKHHNICVFLKTETLQYKNGPKKDGHKNTKTCFCNFPISNKYVCFWRQKHFSTKMALKKKGHKNTKTCFCNLPTCLLSSSKAVESSKGRGPGSNLFFLLLFFLLLFFLLLLLLLLLKRRRLSFADCVDAKSIMVLGEESCFTNHSTVVRNSQESRVEGHTLVSSPICLHHLLICSLTHTLLLSCSIKKTH